MPTEAKIGLLLGIGLIIAMAVLFRTKESTVAVQPNSTQMTQSSELQGQTTANRK